LFFIAAVLLLLPNAGKLLKIITSVLSTAVILAIFYGIVANNEELMYYPALILVSLCILLTIALLIKGIKTSRFFAVRVLSVGVIDSLNRLTVLFPPGWHWRDIILSLYPAIYLIFIPALLGLRVIKEVRDSG
jgi:hypothetical protein